MGRQRRRLLGRAGPTLRRDARALSRPVPHRGGHSRRQPCARRRVRQRASDPRRRADRGERLRARRRSVVTDARARARDGGRRRSRQRRVPARRRADLPVRERRVRHRDLAHGFDVLRRSRSRRSPTSIVRCAPTVDSHSSPGRASPTTSGSPSSARPWPSVATCRHHPPTPPARSHSPTPIACEPSWKRPASSTSPSRASTNR